MVDLLVFVPPVLSAFLGAIAIKTVDEVTKKRVSLAAIQHELVENYWRIDGEIDQVKKEEEFDRFMKEVRLDAIDAVKFRAPGLYIQLVENTSGFTRALASMQYLQREQIESKRPGARIQIDDETIAEDLKSRQDLLKDAEKGVREFSTSNWKRKILYYRLFEEEDGLEDIRSTSAD